MELYGGVGDNTYGQLGDGSNISSLEPVQVKINNKIPLTNVIKIAAGFNHALAITKDGALYAWGGNEEGQIGINSTENANYASRVLNNEGTEPIYSIVDVSAGNSSSIAMDDGGNVYTWGLNSNGQLGIGNNASKSLPQISLCSQAIRVQMGYAESGILKQNGSIESWGSNSYGELGNGSNTSYSFGYYTNTEKIVDYTLLNSTAVTKDILGNILMCGENSFGKYGNGGTSTYTTFTATNVPSTCNSSNKIVCITGSARNVYVVLEDGTIWTTGDNTYGQFSNGSTASSTTYVQARRSDGSFIDDAKSIAKKQNYMNIGTTSYQTLNYISNDGSVYSVGDNSLGQFGNSTTDPSLYYTKMGVPYLNYQNEDIIIKENESYIINENDFKIENEFNVRCDFVPTDVGNLKFETEDENIVVDKISGKITGIKEGFAKVKVLDIDNGYETYVSVKVVNQKNEKIELGSKFTVSLTTSGKVWSWGSNIFGELGIEIGRAHV